MNSIILTAYRLLQKFVNLTGCCHLIESQASTIVLFLWFVLSCWCLYIAESSLSSLLLYSFLLSTYKFSEKRFWSSNSVNLVLLLVVSYLFYLCVLFIFVDYLICLNRSTRHHIVGKFQNISPSLLRVLKSLTKVLVEAAVIMWMKSHMKQRRQYPNWSLFCTSNLLDYSM